MTGVTNSFIIAAGEGNVEKMKDCFVKISDEEVYRSALRVASLNGHAEVVKFLVQFAPKTVLGDEYALFWAQEKGHENIVEILTPLHEEEGDTLSNYNYSSSYDSQMSHQYNASHGQRIAACAKRSSSFPYEELHTKPSRRRRKK